MKKILNYEELTSVISQSNAIIISKTQNCNVCVPVAARLNEMMINYPTLNLFEIYIEDVPEFRGQHLVFTVPTIIVFYEGREIHRESRFIDWEKLTNLFNQMI